MPKIMVVNNLTQDLLNKFDITEWWHQVIDTPLASKITVLSKGTE